ncbi:MAG: PKD domain-containing protein, partial [Thermoanaerobaculia bacterium]|nr:PKD domain-containing protein [Thermoanaerobaculia bacterium]
KVNKPGDYTVKVKALNGCTNTATAVVGEDVKVPDVSAKGGTLTCAVTELTLEAGSATEGVTYSWTGPGIVSGADTPTPKVNKPGTYTVQVTALNGCTNTADATVGEDVTKPTVTLSEPAMMCAGKQGRITVTSSLADVTFEWTITNGWFDAAHTITTMTGTATSVEFYAGTDLTKFVEITVSTKGENGCVGTDVAKIQPVPCEEFHTVTQGYYGNPGGKYFGMTTEQILGALLAPPLAGPGPLTVGLPSHSANFSTVQCILLRLPGGGTSAVLPAGDAGDCPGVTKVRSTRNGTGNTNGLLLDKDGTYTNTLLAQTITLALNLRLDAYITHKNLGMWELCPTVTTKETVMGPDGVLIPNPDPGPDGVLYTADDTKTISIPQSVIDALKATLGGNPTVADLLDFCNQALGGVATGVSLTDIGAAAEAINRGFDMGRFVVSCNVPVTTIESALRVEPSRAELMLCEQIEPVTTWTLLGRNDDISDELKVPIPVSLLTALNGLGLPSTVGGLAELERMVVEGHGYLAGAEPADVIAVSRRVARLITNSDLIGLCH